MLFCFCPVSNLWQESVGVTSAVRIKWGYKFCPKPKTISPACSKYLSLAKEVKRKGWLVSLGISHNGVPPRGIVEFV